MYFPSDLKIYTSVQFKTKWKAVKHLNHSQQQKGDKYISSSVSR